MSWTKEQTFELISLYKMYPHLYNAKHKNYRDRRIREHTLNVIQEKLCFIRKNTSIKDIKVKIKTIRNQYYKEKNLITRSLKNSDKIDDVYQPKLWFFYDIRFIDAENVADKCDISDKSSNTFDFDYIDCNTNNNDISNENISKNEISNEELLSNGNLIEERLKYEIIKNNEISNDKNSIDEYPNKETSNLSDINISSQMKISKIKSKEDLLEQTCRKSLELSQQMARAFKIFNREHQSHLYYFTKSIESDLLALPLRLQHEAKWKIQDIIREAQREHLKNLHINRKHNNITSDLETVINDDIILDNNKNIQTTKNFNIQIKEDNKTLTSGIETLQHLTIEQIFSSFIDYKPMLDSFMIDNKSDIVPKIEGLNSSATANIISRDNMLKMMKHLLAQYEISASNIYYIELLTNLILPEWILALYMNEYKISREIAIQQLNKHEEMKLAGEASYLTTSSSNLISYNTPQHGKPKIYKVIKPISKYNPSSSFVPSQISTTLILGEKNILDTAMENL